MVALFPKPQAVRLADVFLIGPAIIAGGAMLYPARPIFGSTLAAIGIGTIIYNGANWHHHRQRGA